MRKRNHNKYTISLDAIEHPDKDKLLRDFDIDTDGLNVQQQSQVTHPKLMEKLRRIVYEKDGILSPKERLAVILYTYEGRSQEQCAAIMHVRPEHVLHHHDRAVKKLLAYFNRPVKASTKALKLKQAKITRWHQNDSKY